MTTQEAIEIIDKAIAEVEWDYSIEYAAAFDMAKKALEAQEEHYNACDGCQEDCSMCVFNH